MPAAKSTTSQAEDQTSQPNIQTSLANVMADVREVAKKDRNTAQNFSFRGIDAVINAVAPALRKHNVIVMPEVIDYIYETVTIGQRSTQMGHVRLTVRYHFTGPANDTLTATVVGEAMDSGDKATAKAMSVCFRTALLQALALPTDDVDPDAHSYERGPAGLTDAQWTEIGISFQTSTTIEQLDTAAKLAGNLPLSTTQRQELRTHYLERKAAIASLEATPKE